MSRWPFPHDFEFVVFAGGWAGMECRRCGRFGVGGCLWERLFRPCRPSTQLGKEQRG